jgi:hypothetical protein
MAMTSRYPSIVRFALVLSIGAAIQTAGAQAAASICKDGTTSAAEGRGACSGHGGVDAKATRKAQDAVKKEAQAAEARKKAEVANAKVKAAKADTKAERASKEAEATRVTCTDGSMSAGGRGACSGHGGIAKSNPAQHEVEKAETKAAKAEAKVQTAKAKVGNGSAEDNNPVGSIAKCKDGLYSHAKSRRGACGHHGGVASWT